MNGNAVPERYPNDLVWVLATIWRRRLPVALFVVLATVLGYVYFDKSYTEKYVTKATYFFPVVQNAEIIGFSLPSVRVLINSGRITAEAIRKYDLDPDSNLIMEVDERSGIYSVYGYSTTAKGSFDLVKAWKECADDAIVRVASERFKLRNQSLGMQVSTIEKTMASLEGKQPKGGDGASLTRLAIASGLGTKYMELISELTANRNTIRNLKQIVSLQPIMEPIKPSAPDKEANKVGVLVVFVLSVFVGSIGTLIHDSLRLRKA